MEKLLTRGYGPIPLYYRIKEDIKNKIAEGVYEVGAPIPPEFQLMEAYDVSRTTVVKAMSELVNEGLLMRIPGRGTFVMKPQARFDAGEIIGICMRTSGHLYGHFASRVVKNLEEHEFYCVLIDVLDRKGCAVKLEALIEKNPEFLIVDGYHNFPFEVLDKYEGKVIFIFRFESEKHYKGIHVLSDYYSGGRKVAGHFLERGFNEIICITHKLHPEHKTKQSLYKGISDVFSENALPDKNISICPYKDDEKKIKEIISSAEKPAAVFCSEDYTAKMVYKISRELNLRIPEDISVIGYYNTPWCESFHPELTSVSIKEDVMADIVSDKIIGNSGWGDEILLEPEIIERESTKSKERG